jgi:hypothetical protein
MLTLPSSIQQLVGRKLKRISTSHARDRIIFDTWESVSNQRTRYPYSITGSVDRIYNLSLAVGYPITSISALDEEASTGQQKMVIYTTNGFGVIFFSNVVEGDVEYLVSEDGDFNISQEEGGECSCIISEESEYGITIEDVVLADVAISSLPPYVIGADGRDYIVHEFDINYGDPSLEVECPCEET